MDKVLLVGLDLGTTHVKAAAYSLDGMLAAESASPYATYHPRAGWAEQSPADWQAAVRKSLKEVVTAVDAQADKIAAIGLSCHAPSMIPVDAGGEPVLDRVPIWQDERSAEQGRRLLREIGSDWVGLGMPFAAFAAKLKWFTETHPDRARSTRYALGAKGYLAHWLTGRYATDPSSEPGEADGWGDISRACGWHLDRLAPLAAPSDVVGHLRMERCREIGLARPVPVVLGLNDGGSAVLGNGAVEAGEGVLTLGTNGVIFLVSDGPVTAERRLDHAVFCWPYVDGRWVLGGQTKTGGASLQWLLGVLKEGPPEDQDFESALMDAANAPMGSDGVVFMPYLMGRGTPKDSPTAKGTFAGLTMRTTRAHLTRAVLEGVAFTLRDVLEELRRLELAIKRLGITGGGARSCLWRQIVADVLDVPLSYGAGDSCLGAAMLAAVGVGAHSNAASACAAMRVPQEIVPPGSDAVVVYQRLYREFGALRDMVLRSAER